jgi:hypothetical protein
VSIWERAFNAIERTIKTIWDGIYSGIDALLYGRNR